MFRVNPEGLDERKGRDDRRRQRHSADQRAPDAPEKNEDDQNGQDGAEPERNLDVLDGPADVDGLVEGNVELHALGRFDRGDRSLDALRNCNGVLAGLTFNRKSDRGLSVEPGDGPLVLETVLGVADIAELDELPMTIGDHQIIERFRRFVFALGLDNILDPLVLDLAAGNLFVLCAERQLYIACRKRQRLHFFSVKPDPDLPRAAAVHGHRTHAGDLLDVTLQDLVRIVGQVLDVPVSPYGDPDDRLVLGADLLDHRRIRILGQAVPHGRDLIADILCRLFHIPFEKELHRDNGVLFHAP